MKDICTGCYYFKECSDNPDRIEITYGCDFEPSKFRPITKADLKPEISKILKGKFKT